ncbi:transposable element Tcb2 transposase [Trichonephila clavipes]|nr:transposable element Tcb2 transposase [Trichonephila clavipes]
MTIVFVKGRPHGEHLNPAFALQRHNGSTAAVINTHAYPYIIKLFHIEKDETEIHWCAKIKDEVEKLAYQLNEEAEWTERPIMRLSKVMYDSTCADMQVDVMGECLSSIKHVVGSSELLTASFHDFGDNGKLQEQLSGGSIVVVHEEPHPQMTGTLSYRPEETGGRQREKSLDTRHRRLDDRYRVFTVARRLHGGGLFARRPVRCVPLTPAHRRKRSLWCREHRNWRDNEWGRVLFTDESRFSLSSDSHRILSWRERGTRNHPSNIIERDRGAMVLQFLFMDDNAPCHHTVAAEQLLESEGIERMDWPARSPDFNPIKHVWIFLGRRLAARTLPPVTIRELRLALHDEWAAMPQQLIDTLVLSMGRRCETCLAVRGDHIPY